MDMISAKDVSSRIEEQTRSEIEHINKINGEAVTPEAMSARVAMLEGRYGINARK